MIKKLTLEQRIARLEKLLNKTSVKNEGYFEDGELGDWVEGYVMDELSADYRWGRDERDDGLETSKSFERAFTRLANKRAPELIDEIMEACADEFELELEDVEEYRDYITARAAAAAKDCLDTYFKYAESCNRRNKRTRR